MNEVFIKRRAYLVNLFSLLNYLDVFLLLALLNIIKVTQKIGVCKHSRS